MVTPLKRAQNALLLYELEDAREHLGNMIVQMNARGEIDEIKFGIDLGHVYNHINRSWNSRNRTTDQTDEEFETESEFPEDIQPT